MYASTLYTNSNSSHSSIAHFKFTKLIILQDLKGKSYILSLLFCPRFSKPSLTIYRPNIAARPCCQPIQEIIAILRTQVTKHPANTASSKTAGVIVPTSRLYMDWRWPLKISKKEMQFYKPCRKRIARKHWISSTYQIRCLRRLHGCSRNGQMIRFGAWMNVTDYYAGLYFTFHVAESRKRW